MSAFLRTSFVTLLVGIGWTTSQPITAQERAPLKVPSLPGLKLRSIGPSVTGGRVGDFAVDPENPSRYFAAVASGGLWLTENAGVTWKPVFDSQGSYSIGCVTLDPKNPNIVWVGTGENNSQRSVAYGDGVYKSTDGGKTWTNVGLKASEHIGMILIDPRDSNVIWVAAQGPLWKAGGERGLYRSTDGGATWQMILGIDENTGINEVVMSPANPDIMLASAYQRRRRPWTLINGGPGSGIHKSTDGGRNWKKITQGLPKTEMGRIGLAFAPTNPDVVYALVEAAEGLGGVYRSDDQGESWSRQNNFDDQGQYYGEIVVDPFDANRIYIPHTYTKVSDDGGKTLRNLGETNKHVDTHAFWVNPKDRRHYRSGCDGGIYESFDAGQNWRHINNLPITQFYDVGVSAHGPFYHVYGGTQDNFTLGAPAKTTSASGITNADWYVLQGGDGFHVRVDPTDPNVIYCESQYGVLSRFHRDTDESVPIQPEAEPGEPPLRWNWDSPLMISPHDPRRLYFACQRIFRSDDRGNSWKPVSPDLSKQLDRDTLMVMGRHWGADAVAKHLSTSPFGSVVALAESPVKEGRLYAGTDDGLIQISDDGGTAWRKVEVPGAPELAKVTRIVASRHAEGTVYASFDDHKSGNFRPYLFRSDDAGMTWAPMVGNLPERGSVLAIAEDPVKAGLMFVGTEFGLFVTLDAGQSWSAIKNGLPIISVRDLAIQESESDLVVGTFGRGIYILDDYSCLRELTPEALAQDAVLFPSRPALLYIQGRPLGMAGKGFQGASFVSADNPPFGATFNYHLAEDEPKSRKARRKEAEKKAIKAGEPPPVPTDEDLRAEADEESTALRIRITDQEGQGIRVITAPSGKGIRRAIWDLRGEPTRVGGTDGPFVPPGTYRAELIRLSEDNVERLAGPLELTVQEYRPEDAEPTGDQQERFAYQTRVVKLRRAVDAASDRARELTGRLEKLREAIDRSPGVDPGFRKQVREQLDAARKIQRELIGDEVAPRYQRLTEPSIRSRVGTAAGRFHANLRPPTIDQRRHLETAEEQFAAVLTTLRRLSDQQVKELEAALDAAGVPLTPGRLPDWSRD